MELPTVYARQQPAAGRRRLVVAASVVLAFAVVAVVQLAGGGGREGTASLGVDAVVEQFLKKHQQYDVRVPATAKPGSSFIVNVKGHAPERVQVPRNARPGQLLSIQISPNAQELSAAHHQRLALYHSATQQLQGNTQALQEAPADGHAAGVVAEQAGAIAVSSTHEWFKKQETIDQHWIPGDTQALPKLAPLGTGTTDAWTDAPQPGCP
ncbi:hypothetical protein T484DRAFT_1821526 [Baffinella frigidus]|nr:hypothetical protein T484DRAFT_1821526 [Cryptophyta sp. CCMP2293]